MELVKTLQGSATGGGGNATVPGGATILPVQAWVDNIESLSHHAAGQGLDLSSKGLTHFASSLLYTSGDPENGWLIVEGFYGDTFTINLSGNALPAADINAILAALRAVVTELAGASYTVNLTGGTNAAPTGQGITDKTYLNTTGGWTVTTN